MILVRVRHDSSHQQQPRPKKRVFGQQSMARQVYLTHYWSLWFYSPGHNYFNPSALLTLLDLIHPFSHHNTHDSFHLQHLQPQQSTTSSRLSYLLLSLQSCSICRTLRQPSTHGCGRPSILEVLTVQWIHKRTKSDRWRNLSCTLFYYSYQASHPHPLPCTVKFFRVRPQKHVVVFHPLTESSQFHTRTLIRWWISSCGLRSILLQQDTNISLR